MRKRLNRPGLKTKASRITAAPFQCRLVIMAKVPVMGRVKTRLAREVGAVEAVRFFRHSVVNVLARVGRDPRWQTSISVAPDTGIANPFWPRNSNRKRQGLGDLGQRMQRVMDEAGPGPVIIIGTDIPAITASHIARAFTLLRSADAVLGAAADGGYWLVGLRRRPRVRSPFAGVRWSSPTTLTDTTHNLTGSHIAMTDSLCDVDNAAELAVARTWFGRRILPTADN